jgi:tRNA (cytidine/uridine-2'-O-)-methyltransferase
MPLHVVLVAPEIATNTGNIIRLCANTGAVLHLVEPLGFSLDASRLRRAGLDYHELAEVTVHPTLDACLAGFAAERTFALTASAGERFDGVQYRDGDVVVFGSERAGLGPAAVQRFPQERRLHIPMRPGNRSLNLANAVAVVVFEAWRQQDFPGATTGPGSQIAETPGAPPFG